MGLKKQKQNPKKKPNKQINSYYGSEGNWIIIGGRWELVIKLFFVMKLHG